MSDWRDDDLDRRLRPGVDPMNVPEGTFTSIRRQARRRRWAHASSTVAAVAVFGAGIVSGGVVLTGGDEEGRIVGRPLPPVASSPSPSPSPDASSTSSPDPSSTAAPDPTGEPTPPPPPAEESPVPLVTPDTGVTGGDTDGDDPPPPSPTPSTSVPVCTSSEMSASSSVQGAAAGSVYWDFVFTNQSGRSCYVAGYPDVVLLDADKVRLHTQQEPMPPEARRLVLGPGESGSFTVRADNMPEGEDCQRAAQYARFTPGDGQLTVSFESQACHHRLSVSGMTRGSEGSS